VGCAKEKFYGGGNRKANGDGYKQAIELLAQIILM